MNKSSPQAREMGDESMVRNLAAQAEAIWPQESPIFAQYSLPPNARILDVGCGTGEITSRVAELFPKAELLGIDLDEHHLERARARCGAGLHLIAEDYGMLWCYPTQRDPDVFWRDGALVYGEAIGVDLRIGRKMFTLLTDLGLAEIKVTWLVLDTLRVPRDTFARIWEAWRDGYTESLVAKSRLPRSEIEAYWAEMIACVRNPRGYALWHLPLWTAQVPAR